MNHIARFRSEIAAAKDAREVEDVLGRYTHDPMISSQACMVMMRVAAALTRHMDAGLFLYLIGGENDHADESMVVHLLSNLRITDEDWERTLADLLGRGREVRNRSVVLHRLILALATAGRLQAGGPVASALRSGAGTNMGGLFGYHEPERLLLGFAEEPPILTSYVSLEAELALHPLAGPREWLHLLDRPHQSHPAENVNILFANPESLAHPEVLSRMMALAADSVTRLKVSEVMSLITEQPEQTLFWTAAMLGQAAKANKPTPPTFIAFVRERLSKEELASLLDMPDREIRMRALELLGNAPQVRGRKRS